MPKIMKRSTPTRQTMKRSTWKSKIMKWSTMHPDYAHDKTMHPGAWETVTEERRRKHPDRRYRTT